MSRYHVGRIRIILRVRWILLIVQISTPKQGQDQGCGQQDLDKGYTVGKKIQQIH